MKKIYQQPLIDINNQKVEIPMLVYMSKTFQKQLWEETNILQTKAGR